MLTKEKNSDIYCHHSGEFYAVYYSNLKKWVIKDGDYCNLKTETKQTLSINLESSL